MIALVVACGGGEAPLPDQDGSETTTAADSSTGSTGSVTSTMSGSSTATTSSGSTYGGDIDFVHIPDGGVCVVEGMPEGFQSRCWECDLDAQDCARGYKCVPWANDGGNAWNATRCSEVPEDPASVGEPCVVEESPVSGLDSCDLGLLCFEVDPRTLQGTCTPLCSVEGELSCGPDEACAVVDGFAPFVCLPRCDPFEPAACPAAETCRQLGRELVCVPDVVLPQGLGCGADERQCAPDRACQRTVTLAECSDFECCTPWCDLSAAEPELPCVAVPGEVCRPFFEKPPAGHEHVGACGLPI